MNMSYCLIKEDWYDYLAHHCRPSVFYGLPYFYEEEDEREEAEDPVDTDEEW